MHVICQWMVIQTVLKCQWNPKLFFSLVQMEKGVEFRTLEMRWHLCDTWNLPVRKGIDRLALMHTAHQKKAKLRLLK